MRVYKVFNRDFHNGNLRSHIIRGVLEIKYTPGTPSYPHKEMLEHGFGITAFEEIDYLNAYLLITGATNDEIWECEAEVMETRPDSRLPVTFANTDELEDILDHLLKGDAVWPAGTIFCSKLTPIKPHKHSYVLQTLLTDK